jgi:type I site-specific restriction endonuclease
LGTSKKTKKKPWPPAEDDPYEYLDPKTAAAIIEARRKQKEVENRNNQGGRHAHGHPGNESMIIRRKYR